ncbi:hypothetical protein Tco_1096920, partial [Tanacetum coccineum]
CHGVNGDVAVEDDGAQCG